MEPAGRRPGPAARRRAATRAGTSTRGRTSSGCGDGRRDRAEADPEPDAKLLGDFDDGCRELAPPEIRLGARQDQHVATVDSGSPYRQARPRQFGQSTVDDLEGRSPGSVVEQEVAVELDDDLAAVRQLPGGHRGGAAGIDPAVEGSDEGGRYEVVGSIEAVERHPERIGPRSEPVDGDRLRRLSLKVRAR